MSSPNEMYTQWLDSRDETRKRLMKIVSANKSNDADNAIDQFDLGLEHFVDTTRKIFDRDEKRIKVRDTTIQYLQDKLAAKE